MHAGGPIGSSSATFDDDRAVARRSGELGEGTIIQLLAGAPVDIFRLLSCKRNGILDPMAKERSDKHSAPARSTIKTRSANGAQRESDRPVTALADEQLSAMELALTVLWNSVRRWMTQSGEQNNLKGLSELDIFLVHLLVYRNRPLRVIDLAFALSIDDLHQVTYSLKKLSRLGIVAGVKRGKEVFYTAGDEGQKHYEAFMSDRGLYLEPAMRLATSGEYDLPTLTNFLRTLSGVYEQAARSAASKRSS